MQVQHASIYILTLVCGDQLLNSTERNEIPYTSGGNESPLQGGRG